MVGPDDNNYDNGGKDNDDNDNDDKAYKNRYDFKCRKSSATGDIPCNVGQNKADTLTFCRCGHKPYKLMGLSLSFTQVTTSLCVCVRHRRSQTLFQSYGTTLC